MLPNDWKDGEDVKCPAGEPDGKCCNKPEDCDLLGCAPMHHGDAIEDGELKISVEVELREGWKAMGAVAILAASEARLLEKVDGLEQEVHQLRNTISDLHRERLKDVAIMGLYRAAATYAEGLMDESREGETPVAAEFSNELLDRLDRIDRQMADVVDLKLAEDE